MIAAAAPGLGVLIVGYSAFEGVGSALMIPTIYILATLAFPDIQSRARAFGVISGMGGIGAAAGPLIGGLITTTISWRASFLLQAAIVATIVYLSLKLRDPLAPDPTRPFDTVGAVLSAAGMSFLVIGILQAGNTNTLLVSSSRSEPYSCSGSSSIAGRVSAPTRSRCCREACSATGPPISGS